MTEIGREMMSDYFRNYRIRYEKAVFGDADIAGCGMLKIACGKSPLHSRIVTMFIEIFLRYALRGTQGKHHLLQHKLFVIKNFMLLYAAWICDVSLQIGFVPHAESYRRRMCSCDPRHYSLRSCGTP